MLESVKSLFTAYGFRAASIIVATVVIVNLIKKPIMKKAVSVLEKYGYGKTVVTRNFTYLPAAVAFILNFAVEIVVKKFNFYRIDYGEMVSSAVLYGALAIALYESVKIQLKAYAAKSAAPEPEPEKKDGDGEG